MRCLHFSVRMFQLKRHTHLYLLGVARLGLSQLLIGFRYIYRYIFITHFDNMFLVIHILLFLHVIRYIFFLFITFFFSVLITQSKNQLAMNVFNLTHHVFVNYHTSTAKYICNNNFQILYIFLYR